MKITFHERTIELWFIDNSYENHLTVPETSVNHDADHSSHQDSSLHVAQQPSSRRFPSHSDANLATSCMAHHAPNIADVAPPAKDLIPLEECSHPYINKLSISHLK